jgi:[ribosomal protein S5]-alanine N-acetyltransferase
VTLAHGPVGLRPLRRSDAAVWAEVRRRNARWLAPWEASSPAPAAPATPVGFPAMVRRLHREARAGSILPFAVTYAGDLCGQLTVGGITWGSLCSAHVGYWLDEALAGRGVMPTAVALAVDHCFAVLGLHRIEINVRPENAASLRVARKLGFREEGLRREYLHIAGDWRDHISFALVRNEVPGGLLRRWTTQQADG